MNERISEILRDLGVAANLKGYYYLRQAIALAVEDVSYIHDITKRLYPAIAEKFNTTPSRVERSMRHAVESGWLKGNIETQAELFGFTVGAHMYKPTNSHFVAAIADHLITTSKE